jgi:hypothetical protein
VTDYRPTTNEHCLTYEINTPNETFEWVGLPTVSITAHRCKIGFGPSLNRGYTEMLTPNLTFEWVRPHIVILCSLLDQTGCTPLWSPDHIVCGFGRCNMVTRPNT